jgi:NAD/NADP transhydrogenase beta subunit
MIDQLIQLVYLVATALFIFSLKWMSDPTTARRGVFAGVGGMALAILGTLLHPHHRPQLDCSSAGAGRARGHSARRCR